MAIRFMNETGHAAYDAVAASLTSAFSNLDWASSCGVPTDSYNDSGSDPSGPLAEVKLMPLDGNIAENRMRDRYSIGGGAYGDKIYINPGRTGDYSPDQWVSLIAHELLHGSASINRAANILAAKYFKDNPGLSRSQRSAIRSIIEEGIIRDKVNRMAAQNGQGVMERGGDSASDPSLSAESLGHLIDLYDDGTLSPAEQGALADYMGGTPGLGDPCGLPGRLPLMTPGQIMAALAAQIQGAEQTRSPLIVDLDGDGIEALGHAAFVNFDHDRNGFAERTGWVAPDDGLLVLDRNGNGRIDDGSELFGNHSGPNGVNPPWTAPGDGQVEDRPAVMPRHGFDALADFDSNKDRVINASDHIFDWLRVWKDADSDGRVDAGELLTLQQAGVGSLSLSYTTGETVDAQGNSHLQLGSFTTTQGQTRQMTDVWFAVNTMRSIDIHWVEVSEEISDLPDIAGTGNVSGLHQAMARDSSGELKALVSAYAAATTDSVRAALLTDIIYHWAGVQDVIGGSRGSNIDARVLGTLEVFIGRGFRQVGGSTSPLPQASITLNAAFEQLKSYVGSVLDAQTNLSAWYKAVKYTWNDAAGKTTFDVSGLVSKLSSAYLADPAETLAIIDRLGHGLFSAGNEMGKAIVAELRGLGREDGTALNRALASFGAKLVLGDDQNNTLVASISTQSKLIGYGGNDTLVGDAGDDTLDGGAGADRLDGGTGNNTYRFGRGDGADVISARDWTSTKRNVLELKAGVALADLRGARVGTDLVLSIAGTADSVTLRSYFHWDASHRPVQEVRLSTGVVLSMDTLIQLSFGGSAAADTMDGTALADVMTGLAGNDTLHGNAGNDRLDGGEGNDQLFGGEGADSLAGGLGDDWLYGDAGTDTLEGGAGADRLFGGAGQDSYLYGIGDGIDTIHDGGSDGAMDTVQFRSGIGLGNLTISRADSGRDLVVALGTTDRIVLDDRLVNMNGGADRLRFADGKSLSVEALVQAMAA